VSLSLSLSLSIPLSSCLILLSGFIFIFICQVKVSAFTLPTSSVTRAATTAFVQQHQQGFVPRTITTATSTTSTSSSRTTTSSALSAQKKRSRKEKFMEKEKDTNKNVIQPLFEVEEVDDFDDDDDDAHNNDHAIFQVKELEYDDDDGDEDGDEDENDNDEYFDEGQSYTLEYDDVIDVDAHQIDIDVDNTHDNTHDNNANANYYSRDEDDILTEREDRLYVDEKGEQVQLEKCILVAVEDVSALRRDRYNARKRETARIMGMGMDRDDQYKNGASNNVKNVNNMNTNALQQNPEEWDVYFTIEESMNEMRDLIRTCGLELVGTVTQRLNEINPKTYIGTGKVKETQELLAEMDSCTVVFDAELSPGQQKSLENAFNKQIIQNDFLGSEQIGEIKVIDRTALILDIFAQHARTREGKLQVDLALHIFRKPRLTKMWTHLERQSGAGGVGLRGPGESQLEIDKRLLRDRIIVLKRKIDAVQKQRDIHRRGRSNLGLPVLALVGYTNAGKSTLLNYLTRAGVMAENILFATLDPTTRKVKLPGLKTHPEVLLTDTVGFIQKLPTQLVAAFRATLEEVKEADVLLHVMDASNPVWNKQEVAVKRVLSEIDAGDKPVVRVLNKIDLLDDDVAEELQYEAAMMDDCSVAISSKSGEGMIDLVATIEEALMALLLPIEVLLPYTHGKEVNMVQEVGHVEEIDYRVEGTYIRARVPEAIANRLRPFNVNEEDENTSGAANKSNGDDTATEEEIDWVAIGRGRHPKTEL